MELNQGTITALAAAIAGALQAKPVEYFSHDGRVVAAVNENYRIEDLESLGDAPSRIRQKIRLYSPKNFIDYITRFRRDTTTTFLAADLSAITKGAVLATTVIDYHGGPEVSTVADADAPAWGSHTVELVVKPSLGYTKLLALHGAGPIDQSRFAPLLEEISRFCSSHSQGEVVEIARTLSLTSRGAFKNVEDEFTGSVDFQYEMAVKASAGTNDRRLTVPSHFSFSLALIDGLEPVEVTCKFKYRVPEQAGAPLSLGIEIVDRAWIEEAALQEVAQIITEKTETAVYTGEILK